MAAPLVSTVENAWAMQMNPPTITTQIGAVNLSLGSNPQANFPLDSLFNGNGGSMTYTYRSSNNSIAMFSIPTINGVNCFRITGMAVGNVSGTITASNAAGPTTMYFSVSVVDPPPAIQHPLPGNQAVTRTNKTTLYDLNGTGIFSENGGGPMTFCFVATDNGPCLSGAAGNTYDDPVTTVVINPGLAPGLMELYVTGKANPGTSAPLIVKASNAGGQTSYHFSVNVQPQTPPHVVFPNVFETTAGAGLKIRKNATLPAFELLPSASNPGLFVDPDGDTTKYCMNGDPNAPCVAGTCQNKPASANTNIATVKFTAQIGDTGPVHQIAITPIGYGQTFSTIAGLDGSNTFGPVCYTFPIIVNDPPVIAPDVPVPNFGTLALSLPNTGGLNPTSYTRDITVSPFFTDPAGNPITITSLTNSNPAAADVAIQGPVVSPPTDTMFTITPKAAQNTTVTITGCDAYDCTTYTFTVQVSAGQAPVSAGSVNPSGKGDTNVIYLGQADTNGVFFSPINRMSSGSPFYFSDPDNDTLTFSFPGGVAFNGRPGAQYNTSVANMFLYQVTGFGDWSFLITPTGVGTVMSSVQADDGNNNQGTYNFTVHVGLGHAPKVSSTNPIPNTVQVTLPNDPNSPVNDATFIPSQVFTDQDNDLDPSSYAGDSDNPNVATVSVHTIAGVSPQVLLIWVHPVGRGMTNGYVWVTDNGGNKVTYKFTIIVN